MGVLRKLRNAFAHSAESASLTDDTHRMRLEAVYLEARVNPLWGPLQAVLAAQPPSAHGPLDEALRDYILLITILVAFLEATAKQLKPIKPPVVMRFAGIGKGNWGQPGPWRSRQAGERGSALATCCAEGRRSSLSRLRLFPLLLLPRTLQIDPRNPVAESPCREDQLLAVAAVFERPPEGDVGLHVVHKTLQLGPAHREEASWG